MKQSYYIVFLILLALLSRLVPHPVNFAAMTGLSILAARYIEQKFWIYATSILTFFIADIFLGFHSTMFFTYLSQVLLIFCVMKTPVKSDKKSEMIPAAFGGALMGSVIFFVVSNLGVFLEGQLYPQTWKGLVQCYMMAVQFFGNQIAGDLFFTGMGLVLCEAFRMIIVKSDSVA